MLLKPENRATGAVAMGVGLFAQLVLTSVFGALSIAWFITTFIETPAAVDLGVWMIAIIYALGFIILYFNVSWVDYLVGKIKFLEKIKPFFAVLEDYSIRELAYVLWLSACRFAIFTSQYIILMEVFLPELPMLSMVLLIFILFLSNLPYLRWIFLILVCVALWRVTSMPMSLRKSWPLWPLFPVYGLSI